MAALPKILIPTQAAVPSSMDIYTSVLAADTKSQSTAVFTLRNQGVLSSKSRFVFSVCVNDQTTSDNLAAFLPLNVGAHACIDSCVLRCGARELARTENYGQYHGVRQSVHEKQRQGPK